jgi:hypothetical protein
MILQNTKTIDQQIWGQKKTENNKKLKKKQKKVTLIFHTSFSLH